MPRAPRLKKPPAAPRALTDAQEQEVCRRYLAGEPQPSIAAAFTVSNNTIGNIVRRRGLTAAMRVGAPLNAAKTAPKARPTFREAYGSLGATPTQRAAADNPSDPLATADYLVRALEISAAHVMLDEDYEGSERERRKELREIARSIATLTPQALLHRARRMIEADADERDSATSGPEEVVQWNATTGPGPTMVIRGRPRRGRPRN